VFQTRYTEASFETTWFEKFEKGSWVGYSCTQPRKSCCQGIPWDCKVLSGSLWHCTLVH